MFHDMNGGFMWFGVIFWLILFGAIIWAILTIVNKNKGSSRDTQPQETPLEILKNRYAKGEITKEQFEEMKKNII